MREIKTSAVTEAVAELCQEANFHLPDDVVAALEQAQRNEESPLGNELLGQILENSGLAARDRRPLCQDCGLAVVFLEMGQDVHIAGGNLTEAIAAGVSRGYTRGYLRKSAVKQPFSARLNTGDNTPPFIHTEIVPGDRLKIIFMPKGGGAENMARLAMLKPAEGRAGIIDFVLKAVEEAGPNPCPPVIVGVGIGGTAEVSMMLAKHSLIRPVGEPSPDTETAELEREILKRTNALGIGPLGLGGSTTALAVHIETQPCHIASLPVAVNLQCHSARRREVIL